MASALTVDGAPYLFYDGETWVVFYEEVEMRDRLPKILSPEQVSRLGTEIGRFHRACTSISRMVPPPSKTAKSDAVNLFEMLNSRERPPALRTRSQPTRPGPSSHAPAPHGAARIRVRLLAEDPGARRLEPRAISPSRPIRRIRTRSNCSRVGTTTGSASSHACSTSTSCRVSPRRRETDRSSRTDPTPCWSHASGSSSRRTIGCSR